MFRLNGVLGIRRVKEWCFVTIKVLGATVPLWVPEKLVPDNFEGKSVSVEGQVGVDKNGKPKLVVDLIVEETKK